MDMAFNRRRDAGDVLSHVVQVRCALGGVVDESKVEIQRLENMPYVTGPFGNSCLYVIGHFDKCQ